MLTRARRGGSVSPPDTPAGPEGRLETHDEDPSILHERRRNPIAIYTAPPTEHESPGSRDSVRTVPVHNTRSLPMAKEQKRGSREAKKPKQEKPKVIAAAPRRLDQLSITTKK